MNDNIDVEHISAEIEKLTKWNTVNGALERDFTFIDFKKALVFILEVGIRSEIVDHHPEIYNVYNTVKIRLSTHTTNSITIKDIELAKQIDLI
jgi:4a-hydroxytetrahydrobiopterin dehydratase